MSKEAQNLPKKGEKGGSIWPQAESEKKVQEFWTSKLNDGQL